MDWKGKIREIVSQIGYVRLVLLLICVFFLIFVSVSEEEEDSCEEMENQEKVWGSYDSDENDIYVEKMEERLAGILEMIEGAGRVEVMITLSASSETVVGKDQIYEERMEKENSEGGKEASDSVRKEETVFTEKDGKQNPYVIMTMEPVVEGIMIVMDGGNNPSVNQAVTEAVQALFHVDAHKIKVLKMEDGA